MVAPAVFPVAKLGALLLKQISKPIANAVKNKAKSSPGFRKYVCLPPALFYNWCEVKVKMWLLKFGQPVNITVLNEAMAIDLGANLLGEGIIFLIAAGILVSEYQRSSRKEAAKELAKENEMIELKRNIRDLFMQTEEQGAHIRELTRKMGDLETRVIQKPWASKNRGDSDVPPKEPPSGMSPIHSANGSIDEVSNENTEDRSDISQLQNCKYTYRRYDERDGLVLRAVNEIENGFWENSDSPRQQGILIVALNLLYKDVYRNHIRF